MKFDIVISSIRFVMKYAHFGDFWRFCWNIAWNRQFWPFLCPLGTSCLERRGNEWKIRQSAQMKVQTMYFIVFEKRSLFSCYWLTHGRHKNFSAYTKWHIFNLCLLYAAHYKRYLHQNLPERLFETTESFWALWQLQAINRHARNRNLRKKAWRAQFESFCTILSEIATKLAKNR